MKKLKDYLLLYLKGIAMGSADVVPGYQVVPLPS